VLRVAKVEIDRSFQPRVPEFMQYALHPAVAVGPMTTDRTWASFKITATFDFLWLWKILYAGNALCAIRSIFPRCRHVPSLQAAKPRFLFQITAETRSILRNIPCI
jgi:hypothetical protein